MKLVQPTGILTYMNKSSLRLDFTSLYLYSFRELNSFSQLLLNLLLFRSKQLPCSFSYTGIHLRRTICVSMEAMERLPLSNPEGSLTAAQHFEPGDFTFRNRFGRAASQEVGSCEEREAQPYESIIDHTKQSWYTSNATSALTSDAEPNRYFIKYCSKIQSNLALINLRKQQYLRCIIFIYQLNML
ncbi:Hypothetical_protein [Hexamita inflata]|uniref:Hypothetical_protein n=1 Tax=Hexamita inflata TaxID=28002 RepID=A0AA86Q273_9EUKA|nr:Hypothetical protein HINF_LOCUS35902 [Hexamita inflata]CAI9948258.1 Hypothetical protein HINF_LOCUS35903 [Hexamita inflata]